MFRRGSVAGCALVRFVGLGLGLYVFEYVPYSCTVITADCPVELTTYLLTTSTGR